jgi:hypothetical protein
MFQCKSEKARFVKKNSLNDLLMLSMDYRFIGRIYGQQCKSEFHKITRTNICGLLPGRSVPNLESCTPMKSPYECRRAERAGGYMTKLLQVIEVGRETSIWPVAHDPTVWNKNLQICRSYVICT